MIPTLDIRSSWLVDEFGTRQIGDKGAARKAAMRLGDKSARRIELRRRIAEYGSTRAPWERPKS